MLTQVEELPQGAVPRVEVAVLRREAVPSQVAAAGAAVQLAARERQAGTAGEAEGLRAVGTVGAEGSAERVVAERGGAGERRVVVVRFGARRCKRGNVRRCLGRLASQALAVAAGR